jgi:hypothetical protein
MMILLHACDCLSHAKAATQHFRRAAWCAGRLDYSWYISKRFCSASTTNAKLVYRAPSTKLSSAHQFAEAIRLVSRLTSTTTMRDISDLDRRYVLLAYMSGHGT